MCSRWMSALLVPAVLMGGPAVNAAAPTVKTLTDVRFEPRDDSLEITFTADAPLAPEELEAWTDGAVLIFGFDDMRVRRRWLKFDDRDIVRTLLHPTRHGPPRARLRVRLHEQVPDVVLENIRVRAEEGRLVAAVPRNAEIAARWAAATRAPVAVEVPAAEAPATGTEAGAGEAVAPAPEAATGTPAAAAAATGAERPAEAAGSGAEEAATPADEAVTAAVEPLTVEGDAAAPADDEAPRVLSDVGEAAGSGPGFGMVAFSLLLIAGAGWFVVRRSRALRRGGAGGGRLIRPLGSHLLGPRHGLLLVDVAGEMVLLGTSDKGVQMLTKIEHPVSAPPSDAAAPAADGDAPAPSRAGHLAGRLGGVIARLRAAARPGAAFADELDAAKDDGVSESAVERDFFERAEEAVRAAAEDDALAALCDAVEDQPRIESTPRRVGRTPAAGRGRPAAARPTPAPAPAAKLAPRSGPSEKALAADILEKIRRLQGA